MVKGEWEYKWGKAKARTSYPSVGPEEGGETIIVSTEEIF